MFLEHRINSNCSSIDNFELGLCSFHPLPSSGTSNPLRVWVSESFFLWRRRLGGWGLRNHKMARVTKSGAMPTESPMPIPCLKFNLNLLLDCCSRLDCNRKHREILYIPSLAHATQTGRVYKTHRLSRLWTRPSVDAIVCKIRTKCNSHVHRPTCGITPPVSGDYDDGRLSSYGRPPAYGSNWPMVPVDVIAVNGNVEP